MPTDLETATLHVARTVAEYESVLRVLAHNKTSLDNKAGQATAEEIREMADDLLSELRQWQAASDAFLRGKSD